MTEGVWYFWAAMATGAFGVASILLSLRMQAQTKKSVEGLPELSRQLTPVNGEPPLIKQMGELSIEVERIRGKLDELGKDIHSEDEKLAALRVLFLDSLARSEEHAQAMVWLMAAHHEIWPGSQRRWGQSEDTPDPNHSHRDRRVSDKEEV